MNSDQFTILAIETSLDDTCAAVVRGGRVLSNIVNSQTRFHADWGGTVPDIAKRLHQEWLPKVVDLALKKASLPPVSLWHRDTLSQQVTAIAVTVGPGLAPSLEQGISYAKELSSNWHLPLIAVNHMEGHLLSSMVANKNGKAPLAIRSLGDGGAIGFLISGGHTELVLAKGIGDYVLLGETLDDAAGEAYDKVARMLLLGYPGGPILADMATRGTARYPLPEPMTTRKDLNFSFSGLKTASRHFLEKEKPELTKDFIQDFAASFQKAVFKHLMTRLKRSIEEYNPSMILLGGGVVSNVALRDEARGVASEFGIPVFFPKDKKLITDNAAMIGYVGWLKAQRGEFVEDPIVLDRLPNLNFNK